MSLNQTTLQRTRNRQRRHSALATDDATTGAVVPCVVFALGVMLPAATVPHLLPLIERVHRRLPGILGYSARMEADV
jgi:hypothetical protein